jgi:hypothetical protein
MATKNPSPGWWKGFNMFRPGILLGLRCDNGCDPE